MAHRASRRPFETARNRRPDPRRANAGCTETALAHAVGSAVERASRRGDLLAKRRLLMDAWAEFVVVEK